MKPKLIGAIFGSALTASLLAQDYDVVILNGRVMDPETKFDKVSNVGIKGDRITKITTEKITGKKTIDAKGHAVVPGFINTHSHSFGGFDQKMMAHDGTTTILDTESGVADAELFYSKYQGKSFLNFGSGMGHEEIRRVIMDEVPVEIASDPTYILQSRALAEKEDGHASWALDVPTKLELVQTLSMYEKGLRAGAITVNTTVGYMGYNTYPKEIYALQKMAKKYDRFFGAHTRFGPTESLPQYYSLGGSEVIANAVKLDFGVLARNFNPKSKNGGMINIDLLLESKNVPFGKLQMEAATGHLNFDFCPTNLNAGIVDLWATNILAALLPKLDSENQSVINCVIARLKLKNGVIHAETLGLDTTKIRVGSEGSINLKDKSIDLTLTPVPKKAQILSLEVPISIRGTLKKPEISIGSLPVVKTIGRITKNTVLFPIKRIVNKELPADGSDICPCKKGYTPPKQPTEGDLPK